MSEDQNAELYRLMREEQYEEMVRKYPVAVRDLLSSELTHIAERLADAVDPVDEDGHEFTDSNHQSFRRLVWRVQTYVYAVPWTRLFIELSAEIVMLQDDLAACNGLDEDDGDVRRSVYASAFRLHYRRIVRLGALLRAWHEAKDLKANKQSPEASKAPLPRDLIPLTNLQIKIIEALEGKALKKEQLALACKLKDASRLYKSGGLSELIDRERVARKNGVGYYRSDAPPEEWS